MTVSSASLLASGMVISRFQKWPPFLLRGGARVTAPNPAVSLTDWATRNPAHFNSQGLDAHLSNAGNTGTYPTDSLAARGVLALAAVTGTLGLGVVRVGQ